tara:strand:- start:2442 stop:3437 length:996 start_codon:yes stop_codon:yes gene_type:complete
MSVFVIAEAGVNHNGSVYTAKKLIDVAASAGADAVKFQTFKVKSFVTKNAKKAIYQKKIKNQNENQFDMLKKLEFSFEEHKKIITYCKSKKIIFLSSPFDIDSVDLLNKLNLKIFKIPSGEITNLPYLRHIGRLNKKIILSTGMSNMEEVKSAVSILINSGTKKNNITVLHANTAYPTPMKDVNLKAMLTLKKELDINYGYSDHTLGIEIDIAAVAMGASCLEKHFTLDTKMEGPDHKASLAPEELKMMVGSIRNIEKALGNGLKKPSKSELKNIDIVRKSIVAKTKIKKGEVLNDKNITTKRPGYGLSPMKWDQVYGSIAKKNYEEDEFI